MTDMTALTPGSDWVREDDSDTWNTVTIQNQGDSVVEIHINSTGADPATDAPAYRINPGDERQLGGYSGYIHHRAPFGSKTGKIVVIYS